MLGISVDNGTYNYFKLISKYWEKNRVCIEKGIIYDEFPLLETAVKKERDIKWFESFFHLSSKVNTAPTRDDFEKALKLCRFKKISKECQSIINENYQKLYAPKA